MCLRGLPGLALGYAPLDAITVEAVRWQGVEIVLVVGGGRGITPFILVEKAKLAINYRGVWLLLNYGEEELLGGGLILFRCRAALIGREQLLLLLLLRHIQHLFALRCFASMG